MERVNWLLRRLFWPICRLYAGHRGDKPADPLLMFLCSVPFTGTHHYWPDFAHPESFNEKTWHRMLLNRDPHLTMLSDKWRVREYIAERVGAKYLVPLLWHGDNPDDIPFNELPHRFVIKCNHGCGYNIIVQNSARLNVSIVKRQLNAWLNENFCLDRYLGVAWAYKNIQPHLIIEEFIGEDDKPPIDYKFFCYSGHAEFIQISYDRLGNASEKIVDRNFNPIRVWNGVELNTGNLVRPLCSEEMVELADLLSGKIDFIRVDMYAHNNQVYIGELTCYHAGGLSPFLPKRYDTIFGEKWEIATRG